MISKNYTTVLRRTRQAAPHWGNASRHVEPVLSLLPKGSHILDYGCGGGAFGDRARPLGYEVANYDPSVKMWARLPTRTFDAVIAHHVLEHIEPEYLDDTLNEILARAGQLIWIEVPHTPANRTLSDGRNAHLICQPKRWWLAKLSAAFPGWTVTQEDVDPNTRYVCRPTRQSTSFSKN